MNHPIENTLKIPGEAFTQQLIDAENRTAGTEARLEALRLGILSVFDGLNPLHRSLNIPANDHAATTTEKSGKGFSFPDEAYLAVHNDAYLEMNSKVGVGDDAVGISKHVSLQ